MALSMNKKRKNSILSAMDTTLQKAKQHDTDFVLVRGELLSQQIIRAEKDTIRDVSDTKTAGIGVEVVVDKAKGYSYTANFNSRAIEEMVNEAIDGATGSASLAEKEMMPSTIAKKSYTGEKPAIKQHPKDFDINKKKEILMSGTNEILEEDVRSLTSYYGEYWGKRWVMTSDGLERDWNLLKTGIVYRPVVRKNGKVGNATEQAVGSMGLELFKKEEKTPIETAKKALEGARDMAQAKPIKAGKYPLVADPLFCGVIAHESFGHLTESDFIITGDSILSDRKGKQLGSEHATIIESGDPKNYGFYLPYDDEGTATKTVHLLKNGVLKNFLHSRYTAETLGEEPTGNARALTFRYPSIVRMRNTYFGAGNHSKEELFEMIDEGVYVAGSQGGQTESTGTFTFAADRAYWVEDGEIQHAVKGAVVRGNILNFLQNVIGASKQVEVETGILGGCGKSGQNGLSTGLGGPYLAVKEAILSGGR